MKTKILIALICLLNIWPVKVAQQQECEKKKIHTCMSKPSDIYMINPLFLFQL